MRPNVTRGSSARGALDYVLGKGADKCWIVGTNLDGAAPRQLASQFKPALRQRNDVTRPIWHCTLSLPEGEDLTDEQWGSLVCRFLENLGLDPDDRPYVAVKHEDTAHRHCHIVTSRTDFNGRLWLGRNEGRLVQRACAELEHEFGLQITYDPEESRDVSSKSRVKLKPGEVDLWKRRGANPPKITVAEAVDRAISAGDGSLDDFRLRLALAGIETRVSGTATLTGISFALTVAGEFVTIKGSDVGKGYRARDIQARLDKVASEFGPPRNKLISSPRRPNHPAPAGRGRAAGAGVGGSGASIPDDGARTADLLELYRLALDRSLPGGLDWIRQGVHSGPIEVALKSGQRIVDDGAAVSLTAGTATREAVRAMMVLAEINHWSAIELSGTEEFRALAWLEAQRRGIAVVGYQPSDDLQRQWHEEQQDDRSCGSVESQSGERIGSHLVAELDEPGEPGNSEGGCANSQTIGGDRACIDLEDSPRGEPIGVGAAGRGDETPREVGEQHQPGAQPPDNPPTKGDPDLARDQHRIGRRGYSGWDARFRKASAARRRDKEGASMGRDAPAGASRVAAVDGRYSPLARELIDEARSRSPEPILRQNFGECVTVNRRGDEIVVAGKMRVSLQGGHWVACGWGGEPIGDNIALVQHLAEGEMAFKTAVGILLDLSPPEWACAPAPVKTADRYPIVPRQNEKARHAGRTYLADVRGISMEAISRAEGAGVLAYCDNGVLCLAHDQYGQVRSVTIRHPDPVTTSEGKTISKRNLADSDKAYAAVLPGSDQVVLVEGLVDGLAVVDMAMRKGDECPTVIITGGVGVRSWLRTPYLRSLIVESRSVVLMGEREVTPAVQERTDVLRELLSMAVEEVAGTPPLLLYPPPGCKDAAEWNILEQGAVRAPG